MKIIQFYRSGMWEYVVMDDGSVYCAMAGKKNWKLYIRSKDVNSFK